MSKCTFDWIFIGLRDYHYRKVVLLALMGAAVLAFLTGCQPAQTAEPAVTLAPESLPAATMHVTLMPIPQTAAATSAPTFTRTPTPSRQPASTVFTPAATGVPRIAFLVGGIARCELTFQDGRYILGAGCEKAQKLLAVPVGDTIWVKIQMVDAHETSPAIFPVEGSQQPKINTGFIGWQFSQSGWQTVKVLVRERYQGTNAIVEIQIYSY